MENLSQSGPAGEGSREPRVNIIVLNWNSYNVTRDCLLSLQKLDYTNHEVVVVDNGSADSSGLKLAEDFPEVRLIQNERNLGFSGGCNVGIRDALSRGTDYVLLLNNDTVAAPALLRELVRISDSSPQVGMVNPKIYFFDPADRIWYAGGVYKPGWSFSKHIGVHKRDDGSYDQTHEVSFVTGCALLVKAEVVRRVGLLDEMFFLSFEDLDWCVRALHAGFKALYVPAGVVWHKDAHDTTSNLGKAGKDFHSTRSSVLFARKHLSAKYWPLFLLSLGRFVAYRTAGYLIRIQPERVVALYRGMWSGFLATMPVTSECA